MSFVIINAREFLSKSMINELEKRVSFPIYQDNWKENVWGLLEGGKDDMYLYDRCGRLTFYIPFPLSIIHPQQPIVSAAIHATYYDKVCGESCQIDDMDSIIPQDYEESLDNEHSENTSASNTDFILDVDDMKKLMNEENNADSNDSLIMVDDVGDEFSFLLDPMNNTLRYNETDLANVTALDLLNDTIIYFDLNDTLLHNETEVLENMTDFTDIGNSTSILNGMEVHENVTTQTPVTDKEEKKSFWEWAYSLFSSSNKTSGVKLQLAMPDKNGTTTEPSVTGRCQDPSHEQMCIEWNKKKLWHAYFCCNRGREVYKPHRHGGCGHFKPKKCKKLQPILKCCLGTANAPGESNLDNKQTTTENSFATVG